LEKEKVIRCKIKITPPLPSFYPFFRSIRYKILLLLQYVFVLERHAGSKKIHTYTTHFFLTDELLDPMIFFLEKKDTFLTQRKGGFLQRAFLLQKYSKTSQKPCTIVPFNSLRIFYPSWIIFKLKTTPSRMWKSV